MPSENLTEKVSVNVNTSALSEIDLLVDNGYYSHRSDFINQAVREALEKNSSLIERLIEKSRPKDVNSSPWFIGVSTLDEEMLREAKEAGKTISLTGYGLLIIREGFDENLLFETVDSLKVKGRVKCSAAIRAHYGLK